jgi:phosphate-selective porin
MNKNLSGASCLSGNALRVSGRRLRLSGVALARVGMFVLVFLSIAGTALAQRKPVKKGLVWDRRPSIVFGRNVYTDIHMKGQFDWRTFDPEVGEPLYDFRSLRFGLKGELTRHFEYEIERKINSDWEAGDWKDVYLMWKTYDQFNLQAGKFKMPFSNDQTTGSTDLDFGYRSLGAVIIAPSRDRGVMASGRFWGRDLTYQIGWFRRDGDHGDLKEPQFVLAGEKISEPGPSIAARVTGTPLRKLPVHRRLRSVRVGAAYTTADLPEGLNSLRGKTVFGTKTFFEPVYVKGRRQRYGLEFEWTPRAFGFKAEWMQARENRRQQSNRNQDLSDFISTGWLASASWVVTGESYGDSPEKDVFNGGIGKVEVGARYERLGFASAAQVGTAYTNPRSEYLAPNTDRAWTIGVNWQTSRWVKMVGNAVRESFDDPKRTIASGVNSFWTGLLRLQVVF